MRIRRSRRLAAMPIGFAAWLALAAAARCQPLRVPSPGQIRTWPVAKIEAALPAGAALDTPYSDSGYTPLIAAAALGRADVAALLLRRGADPNRLNDTGPEADFCPPLSYAVRGQQDDVAVLDALVKAGARVKGDQRCPQPPLNQAALNGKIATVRFLLSKGANPNGLSLGGRTPLTDLAATHARLPTFEAVVDALLAAGAELNRRDAWGETPLVAALRAGGGAQWQELLAKGSDPRLTDNMGNTAATYIPADLKPRLATAAAAMNGPPGGPVFSQWTFPGRPARIGGAEARVAATGDGLHVADLSGKEIGSAPASPYRGCSDAYSQTELIDIDGDGVRDYSLLLKACGDAHQVSLYVSLHGGRTNLLVNYDEDKSVLTGSIPIGPELRGAISGEFSRRHWPHTGDLWNRYRIMADVVKLARLQATRDTALGAYRAHRPREAVRIFGDPLAMVSEIDPSDRDDQVTAILNDYGFFLAEAGQHARAINVLQIVIARAPDRAVAHLNLADAAFARGDKDLAARHYGRYVALMKEADKRDKIPARVADRLGHAP